MSVDLPDHGDSWERADVTTADVVGALVATVDDLGLSAVVPVTLSHAGWAAIELRRRLGAERVPAVVLLDRMVLGTPPGFAGLLRRVAPARPWRGWAARRGWTTPAEACPHGRSAVGRM